MSREAQLTAWLVPFYRGQQPDVQGRRIEQMWSWNLDQLEACHDYIQWLFPNSQKSAFNPNAPVVDPVVVEVFQSDPQLQKNLRRSLLVMLQFYGLQRQETSNGEIWIEPSEQYSVRKQIWLWPGNHNYRRITRILQSLSMLGLPEESRALYKRLQKIYQEEGDRIGSRTFQHWTAACK